MSLVFELFR